MMKNTTDRFFLHLYNSMTVWNRNFIQFKKTWSVSLFWILIEPTLYLVALGYGVGSYIPKMNGVSYIDFYFPALLCVSSMMVAFFETTYANYSKLTYQNIYNTMVLTPLEPFEIVLGEVFWGATKGLFSAFGVAFVATFFGIVDLAKMIPVFGILFVSSFLFASIGMIVTSIVKNYDQIIYPTSGFIVPMSLFSGTFFPIDQLPVFIKFSTYLLPLSHTVSAVRTLLLEGYRWSIVGHVLFLIVLSVICLKVAAKKIQAKLIS